MRKRVAVLVLAGALPCVSSALGNDQEEARRLMEEGVAADQSGDKERAVELFTQSLALHPSYDVAGNLGLVKFGLGRYADAANHLSYCLRHFASGQKRELRKLIEEKLLLAREHVAEVTIQVSEPLAEVMIGDEVVGRSPLDFTVFVEPGSHELAAVLGKQRAQEEVELTAGAQLTVDLQLPPAEEVAPTAGGQYESARPKAPPWWPAYVGGGLALASLGVSITARVMADSERDEIAAMRETLGPYDCSDGAGGSVCSDLRQATSRYNTRATVADATLVATGVFAAATVGYVTYVLVQRKKASRQSEMSFVPVPVFSDRTLGLMVQGEF